ncbi:hypothetical protein M0804_011785 [Polistes exclamans]|nr:hypothetical protein M0804_011785 [Polistes exclamans]
MNKQLRIEEEEELRGIAEVKSDVGSSDDRSWGHVIPSRDRRDVIGGPLFLNDPRRTPLSSLRIKAPPAENLYILVILVS